MLAIAVAKWWPWAVGWMLLSTLQCCNQCWSMHRQRLVVGGSSSNSNSDMNNGSPPALQPSHLDEDRTGQDKTGRPENEVGIDMDWIVVGTVPDH